MTAEALKDSAPDAGGIFSLEGCYLTVNLPDEPTVCIVRFEGVPGMEIPQNPCVHLQVTIDWKLVSPGGEFIRFDASRGDEIHGWQRRDRLIVCEVLGRQVVEEVNGVKTYSCRLFGRAQEA